MEPVALVGTEGLPWRSVPEAANVTLVGTDRLPRRSVLEAAKAAGFWVSMCTASADVSGVPTLSARATKKAAAAHPQTPGNEAARRERRSAKITFML